MARNPNRAPLQSSGTTYTAGTGLLLSSGEFSLDESYSPKWTSNHWFESGVIEIGQSTGPFDSAAAKIDTTGSGIGIGSGVTASGTSSLALGSDTTASQFGSIAIGNFTTAEANYAMAFGRGTVSTEDTVAFMSNGGGMSLEMENANGNKIQIFNKNTGSMVNRTNTISSNYTTSGEDTVFADVSGGSLTVTLSSNDTVAGKQIKVKDSAGNAGTNTITINTEGSENIDGSSSSSISSNYGVVHLESDGSNWYVM